MIKVICDGCGKEANKPYCDANEGKTVHSLPYKVTLEYGMDESNYNNAFGGGDKTYDLCGTCFRTLKEIVTRFLAERMTS